MPDSPLPEYVDARKIFSQEDSLAGSIDLGRLPGITSYLSGDDGEVTVEIGFKIDDFGRKRIIGKLSARLVVECQRCLEPLVIELNDKINLVLVVDEAAAKELDPQFDPWIVEDHKINLANLIDEQLVLCMPIVNYHQDGPCSERIGYSTTVTNDEAHERDVLADEANAKTQNPFAVLASWKKK